MKERTDARAYSHRAGQKQHSASVYRKDEVRMAERKEIPPPTPDVVIPPNLDRKYFEAAADHPFQPRSVRFELVNAWWLAEASLLAYAAPADAAPRFEDGGFQAEFFPRPTEGTQAHLLVRDPLKQQKGRKGVAHSGRALSNARSSPFTAHKANSARESTATRPSLL